MTSSFPRKNTKSQAFGKRKMSRIEIMKLGFKKIQEEEEKNVGSETSESEDEETKLRKQILLEDQEEAEEDQDPKSGGSNDMTKKFGQLVKKQSMVKNSFSGVMKKSVVQKKQENKLLGAFASKFGSL